MSKFKTFQFEVCLFVNIDRNTVFTKRVKNSD